MDCPQCGSRMTLYDGEGQYSDCWICDDDYCLHMILKEDTQKEGE